MARPGVSVAWGVCTLHVSSFTHDLSSCLWPSSRALLSALLCCLFGVKGSAALCAMALHYGS